MTGKKKRQRWYSNASDLDKASGFFRYTLEEDDVDWDRFPEDIVDELADIASRAMSLLERAALYRKGDGK